MKAFKVLFFGTLLLVGCAATHAVERYVSLSGGHVPPYATWSGAATNIQDAIDVANDGDVIWVTNGIYGVGGKVMAGDLTNRVALDKALTVQSVNGPFVTTLQGNGATNNASAVRCAWLTNGATLRGFTLTGGATRTSGDTVNLLSGGGIWCASSNATVANCLVVSNNCSSAGSGAFRGTLWSCLIRGNKLDGAVAANMINCTVVSNSRAGVSSCRVTNSIVCFNSSEFPGSTLTYCCTVAAAAGAGNFIANPGLMPDGIHIASDSLCKGTGANLAAGVDIDGLPWGDPPSIGCDEVQQSPPLLVAQPRVQAAKMPARFMIETLLAGEPATCFWMRDGTAIEDAERFSGAQTSSLSIARYGVLDTGSYQVVASNAYGMVTSDVLQVTFRCVDAAGSSPVPPYTNWATAAISIQDAIEVSTANDVVLVTNGVYATGGKVMAGDLTNRVALDKPLIVTSVNGPFVTTIQGIGAVNGTAAVRCAWLTNGATLSGFTLINGATRTSGDTLALQSGGGVWCASTNASVANCLVVTNNSNAQGSGAYQGTLRNCLVRGNLRDGVTSGNLVNCTVMSNALSGLFLCRVTNSIVCSNKSESLNNTYAYCCTASTVSGAGNIRANPRLLSDGIHLANDSPCRSAGTNFTFGVDMDGEAWANPPSIGCDQWQPAPWIVSGPRMQFTYSPVGFSLSVTVVGQEPFTCWWYRNGTLLTDDGHFANTSTTNLLALGISPADVASYQVVVSNTAGMTTSTVTQVVGHYVDAAGANSVSPYTTWATAATNIQDAINVASAGEFVFVTNGTYATGGKAMAGNLTNRVALDKALMVQSVNGPGFTVIRGNGNATVTNAIRCAWLTNGAALGGFTLIGGATRATGDSTQTCGGGAWSSSTNALLFNCAIAANSAYSFGGGAYQTTLRNCTLRWNTAGSGGGAYGCELRSCVLVKNSASANGSGAYGGTLVNCVSAYNEAVWTMPTLYACGVENAKVTNSIVVGNSPSNPPNDYSNYRACVMSYSCSQPLPPGAGNISADPQMLADASHIAGGSPCRAAGTNVVSGTDIDGQPWENPPSMGCDEWWPQPAIATQPEGVFTGKPGTMSLGLLVVGQPPFTCLWSKDGDGLTEGAHYGSVNTTNLLIRGLGPDNSGIYQVTVSNASGLVTSQPLSVTIHCVDAAGSGPLAPYTNWLTAATTIQEAIDAANAGDVILVTNGVYASGGCVMEAGFTNRVALYKPLAVLSVNGPMVTTIRGQWDPVTTNGPAAVRCVWMTNNTALNGFTVTGGATSAFGGGSREGGGIRASGIGCNLVNSMILSNSASGEGGGLWNGRAVNCSFVGNQAVGFGNGGAAFLSSLVNCTVVANYAATAGGAIAHSEATNSIIYFNASPKSYPNQYFGRLYSCCSPDWYMGSGNITSDPQLVDAFHIAATSPCRGAGNAIYAVGADLDGEDWLSPPSIGCDEIVEAALLGPLVVAIEPASNTVLVNHTLGLAGRVTGRAVRLEWNFGDGPAVTNASYITSHTWTNAGDYPVTFTAFNADNPDGVVTNLLVRVLPVAPPTVTVLGMNGTNFQLHFSSQALADYWVEYTTNLTPPITWLTMSTLTSTGGVVQVTDPSATNEARFYRVRAR